MILLADASQYQGQRINFKAMADVGVRGVYIEAQRGNDGPNCYFAEQVASAKMAGLAVGAYLLAYPLIDDGIHRNRAPVDQVHLFWEACDGLGNEDGSLPPMLDCEWPVYGEWAKWGVTARQAASWYDSALTAIDQQWRRRCGVYHDVEFWPHLGPYGQTPGFGSRALWLAQYTIDDVRILPPGAPPPARAPWNKVTLWQYTRKFEVPGSGVIADCSLFLGDEDDWTLFLSK